MSLEYYKKQCAILKKDKSYAWAQYYSIRNKLFETQQDIYTQIENDDGVGVIYNHDHLQKFISELYAKAKVDVECAICMETITSETLDTTKCGHNFHKECMNSVKEKREVGNNFVDCPICRTKLWAIKSK